MYENNDKDYETLARSNENLRDNLEGKLHEPRMDKSTENSNGNRGCKAVIVIFPIKQQFKVWTK